MSLRQASTGDFLWTGDNTAVSNRTLYQGQAIYSSDDAYYLEMETDGNLVEYNTSTGDEVWSTGTTAGSYAWMQSDGNLVVYSSSNAVLWSSGTSGHAGAVLTLKTNGSLVITLDGTVIWTA